MDNKLKTAKIHENSLFDEIYLLSSWNNSKILFLFLFFSSVFFFLNFPFTHSLKTIVENKISSIPGRPITFGKMEIDYLLFPGLDFDFFKYHSGGQEIKFKTLTLDIIRPSVFPPGIRLELEGLSDKTKVKIKTSLSFLSHRLIVEDTHLSGDFLYHLTGQKVQIKGNLEIQLQTSLEREASNMKAVDGKVFLKSSDLEIPSQIVSGFEIPLLALKHFVMEAEIDDKGILNISKFELGNTRSAIYLKGRGTIYLNSKNILMSKLAINSEIQFSKQLLESFQILNNILENKKTVNGMYQVKIQGTLGSPTPLVQD